MKIFLQFILLLISVSSTFSCDYWIDEEGNEYRSGYWGPEISEFILYSIILFLITIGVIFLINKNKLNRKWIYLVLILGIIILIIIWIIYYHLNLHSC